MHIRIEQQIGNGVEKKQERNKRRSGRSKSCRTRGFKFAFITFSKFFRRNVNFRFVTSRNTVSGFTIDRRRNGIEFRRGKSDGIGKSTAALVKPKLFFCEKFSLLLLLPLLPLLVLLLSIFFLLVGFVKNLQGKKILKAKAHNKNTISG